MKTCSASAYELKGLPFHTTTSAILPASRVPVWPSIPSARRRWRSSGDGVFGGSPACVRARGGNHLGRFLVQALDAFGESEWTMAQLFFGRSTNAMFSGMPSKASILKPHQSAHSAPQTPSAASRSASL